MSLIIKPTSQTRLIKNKYKIDSEPFQMSQFEWRGTLNEGELFYKFKYNLGAWKVKIAEIEDDLYIVDYIYAGQENSNIKNSRVAAISCRRYVVWNLSWFSTQNSQTIS